ncbi:MAG: hypothetical protein H0V12_07900 [Chloroflexi bacterium]|nr:hypothetical protein [Chloroflexota bacterium]
MVPVGGEFFYVIEGPATAAGQGIVVTTRWRQQKKNGEWGKPQSAGITIADIPQLADAVDREILTTLLGAADPYMAGYNHSYPRTTFNLSGPITDRALRLLASIRRLYLRGEGDPLDVIRPVSADTGSPWTFRPDITTADDGTVHLHGRLTRDDETMALIEPQLLLPAGYVIARGALARLEHGGAFPWLARLRQSGPAVIPPDAASLLVEALARTGVDPSVLPPALQYEVVDATPRPAVKIVRPPGLERAHYRLDSQATPVLRPKPPHNGNFWRTGEFSPLFDAFLAAARERVSPDA